MSGRRAATGALAGTVEPVVRAAGFDLEGLTVTPVGRRRVVRVVVDRDGGAGLDLIADLSRALSERLDAGDVLGAAPYVLEVTSPGVDRPLTLPRHWRRAAGRLVEVVLADGSRVTGRVVAAGEAGADLDVPDAGGERRTVAYGEVRRATVQVELTRRPGEPDDLDAAGDDDGDDPDDAGAADDGDPDDPDDDDDHDAPGQDSRAGDPR